MNHGCVFVRWGTINLLIVLLLSGLSGCQSFEQRTQQRSAAWAALDGATQARLRLSKTLPGDTADMVYLAHGAPDRVRERTTGEGKEETWVYVRRWQEYRGQVDLGVRPVEIRDPATGKLRVYFENVQRPLYEWREQDHLRILLRGGAVTAIEETR